MIRKLTLSLLLISLFCRPASAQGRSQARSMVISRDGIVATSHVQASVAGAQILAKGGSAVDAAIAANAALGVTEPMMNGIGGDLFAIYWDAKSGNLYGLNSSGWAPQAMTPEHLKSKGATKMPGSGIDTVTVPGAVAGWNALHTRFGKLPWKQVFQPAIHYAREGYPVPELIHGFWEEDLEKLSAEPESRRVYLPNGKVPEIGQIFSNPDLAKALQLIADDGANAFYQGKIAQAILATSRDLGGTMAADDLAAFSPEWVDPISTTYRGWTIYELPPNGQGMAALEMLNLMETSPASSDGPSTSSELHKKIEAMKLAYADLYRYDADPRFAKVPVKGLLSKEYAQERARLIDPAKANCAPNPGKPPASETTYLTAVDRDGNIVSLIQSNYAGFGSGITVRGMGFALQNRGALFSLDPASPNVLAPRKRPFHTIIPAFMEKGDLHIGFGIMGGPNQPLAHAQFVSNVVDYGMNIQAALENPRFTVSGKGICNIVIESRVKPDVRDQLTAMGHIFQVDREYSTNMGRGQAVLHDSKTGVNYGASDPRTDGSAEIQPPQ
jgi:gamma-glutamyltranspeptidase / glutathione hydrolase